MADALLLHLLSAHSDAQDNRVVRGGLAPVVLRKSLDRLHEAIAEGVSLDDLAREAGLSRSHFISSFRQSTGVPPHRHLTQIRLQRAKTLLIDTKLPIVDIALQCGFSSQAHLITSFTAAFGRSPSLVRRQRG